MINVDVFSDERGWSSKLKKKQTFFNEVCKAFPKRYKFSKKKVSLSILLSNNKKIKKLNKNFRNKNKPTDILSFPFSEKNKIKKKTYIGDIIISYDFLNKPKMQKIKIFREKLIRIFIHGFLHLLNFDHKKDTDYKKMLKEEKRIFKSVISKIN
ncbi:rRNA maturation RNase YbeY [Candidatus Pelagibacter sp.]|nr:rRNA maturation RNase YbeY [Candidatus Pelagibacter sp.]|tara:strand:+ start:507 stop:968 length:462 start_codon:yes stop_codon:yes gene_type:complete